MSKKCAETHQDWRLPAWLLPFLCRSAKSSEFDVQSAKNYPRTGLKSIAHAGHGYYN
jgi:hypothetical protein